MILLASFNNEIDAQLLESQLKEAGIDNKVEESEGGESFKIMVFEDDLEEAREIMEARSLDEDPYVPGVDDVDLDLDEFEDA
jgi:hypothetical protein